MPAAVECKTHDFGAFVLRGPEREASAPHRWLVTLVDRTLETAETKPFANATTAQAFIDTLIEGHAASDPLADLGDETPKTSRLAFEATRHYAPTPTPPQLDGRNRRPPSPGEKRTADASRAPFNLKAVREALEEYELDPFVEIARVLKATKPVLYPSGHEKVGQQVLDPETGEPQTTPLITGIDRAKVLVELGQYVAPKLKAVEMKVEDKNRLTEAEVDARIIKLMTQAAAEGGAAP